MTERRANRIGWRTGTKNPHALYFDDGAVSVPHGFVAHPEVARRIVALLNAHGMAARGIEAALTRWLNTPWERPEPDENDWREHMARAYRAGWNDSAAACADELAACRAAGELPPEASP